jgi:hypothetical protein
LRVSNDKYTGEKLLLDPHTKILTVWGTQAMKYLYDDNRDSAIWCLKQAAQRGGINKTVANYFRQVLSECSSDAYLFTMGDMYTYYLSYLQLIDRYRTDVTCIDLNLLNTIWYPSYLYKKDSTQFNYNEDGLYRINTIRWETRDISIANIVGKDTSAILWQLQPTNDKKLLRSSQILLDMLQRNAFNKPVFFAGDVPSNMKLFLDDFLQCKGLTNRLMPYKSVGNLNELESRLKRLPVLSNESSVYLNNTDNIQVLNNYRFAYATAAIIASKAGDSDGALQFTKSGERKYPETVLPYSSAEIRLWFVNQKLKAQQGQKLY